MTTERIDVLAVMESAAKWRGDFMDDYVSAAELREARAAVAELIEAVVAVYGEPCDDGEQSAYAQCPPSCMSCRIRAALARVGGAP